MLHQRARSPRYAMRSCGKHAVSTTIMMAPITVPIIRNQPLRREAPSCGWHTIAAEVPAQNGSSSWSQKAMSRAGSPQPKAEQQRFALGGKRGDHIHIESRGCRARVHFNHPSDIACVAAAASVSPFAMSSGVKLPRTGSATGAMAGRQAKITQAREPNTSEHDATDEQLVEHG